MGLVLVRAVPAARTNADNSSRQVGQFGEVADLQLSAAGVSDKGVVAWPRAVQEDSGLGDKPLRGFAPKPVHHCVQPVQVPSGECLLKYIHEAARPRSVGDRRYGGGQWRPAPGLAHQEEVAVLRHAAAFRDRQRFYLAAATEEENVRAFTVCLPDGKAGEESQHQSG